MHGMPRGKALFQRIGLRHAVVAFAVEFPKIGVQRAAERHVEFLNAAADAEDG